MEFLNMNFLEVNYFDFLKFKIIKSETQAVLNTFCDFYLENFKGFNKDNLESLRLFFSKFLKDNKKDSIFLTIFNNSLKICIYDSNIDFVAINDSLESLKDFIKEFKEFLND